MINTVDLMMGTTEYTEVRGKMFFTTKDTKNKSKITTVLVNALAHVAEAFRLP